MNETSMNDDSVLNNVINRVKSGENLTSAGNIPDSIKEEPTAFEKEMISIIRKQSEDISRINNNVLFLFWITIISIMGSIGYSVYVTYMMNARY